jgi:hypothetical protein
VRVNTNENKLIVDVDETLILWRHPGMPANMSIDGVPCRYNIAVIEEIFRYKARGHYIYVWSAGGADWARTVVELLGIEAYVDEVGAKPKWAIDDKLPTEWLETYYVKDFTC